MKKISLTISLILSTYLLISQNDSVFNALIEEVSILKNQVTAQNSDLIKLKNVSQNYSQKFIVKDNEINNLEKINSINNKRIDSISNLVNLNNQNLGIISNDLEKKIDLNDEKSNNKISVLNGNVDKNKLYWIIATLLTLITGALIFWLMGKRINSSNNDIESQINKTKKYLENESIKLDSKLIELLESQLIIINDEASRKPPNESEDHSLALKVADEIVRMQKNISKMDIKTKGIKPLVKGIERIQENFKAKGYEIINLLNKNYDDRMKIDVINFNDDEDLEEGKRIITKITKPQVNFKGKLIQRAQVDVSQN